MIPCYIVTLHRYILLITYKRQSSVLPLYKLRFRITPLDNLPHHAKFQNILFHAVTFTLPDHKNEKQTKKDIFYFFYFLASLFEPVPQQHKQQHLNFCCFKLLGGKWTGREIPGYIEI